MGLTRRVEPPPAPQVLDVGVPLMLQAETEVEEVVRHCVSLLHRTGTGGGKTLLLDGLSISAAGALALTLALVERRGGDPTPTTPLTPAAGAEEGAEARGGVPPELDPLEE